MSPLEIHMDPCLIRVNGAVTASASFPPVIGPITLQVAGEETYWHAGDGGLYENSGFESLFFLFLKRLQGEEDAASPHPRLRQLAPHLGG